MKLTAELQKKIVPQQHNQIWNIEKKKKTKKMMTRTSLSCEIQRLNKWVIEIPNGERQEKYWRNNGHIFSKIDENSNSTDPRNSTNFKHKKCEEDYTKAHHTEIAQNQW